MINMLRHDQFQRTYLHTLRNYSQTLETFSYFLLPRMTESVPQTFMSIQTLVLYRVKVHTCPSDFRTFLRTCYVHQQEMFLGNFYVIRQHSEIKAVKYQKVFLTVLQNPRYSTEIMDSGPMCITHFFQNFLSPIFHYFFFYSAFQYVSFQCGLKT